MRNAMLSCVFASAILSHTAFLSQNAVAGSSEAGQTKGAQAEPRLRLAQNTGAAEAAAKGEISLLIEAAKAEKGKEAPIPAVDDETLSLYPTAAQCAEWHKQTYQQW